MREAKIHFQRIALNLCAETHTDQIQTTLKTFANTGNHIVYQGTQCT